MTYTPAAATERYEVLKKVSATLDAHTAENVAALQVEAEADLATVRTFAISDAATFGAADETLTTIVTQKDAVKAMRTSATGPMYQAIKVVESWFRPVLSALEGAETHLKGAMGAYREAEDAARREASATAAVAATSGDSAALVEALTISGAAPAAARASTTYAWRVLRIAEDMVPDEYWTIDLVKLGAIAKSAGGGDEPPIVPGVVFERVAKIGARR